MGNARAYLALREGGRSLSQLALDSVGGAPRRNSFRSMRELPAKTTESDALSKELKRLAWLSLDSQEGQEYWAAMELMGRYAAANHTM